MRDSRMTVGLSRIACVISALMTAQVAEADDVRIWIRAFVPDIVAGFPDFSEPVASNPAQYLVRASDGGCLATDHRTWTESDAVTSRLSSDFHLTVDSESVALRPSGKQITSAAAVHTIDCTTGATVSTLQTALLADQAGVPSASKNGPQISVLAAIADPQRAWSSATIHYDASFTYDQQSRTLTYQASTGIFPAYEAYASLNDGPAVMVFRSGPFRRNDGQNAVSLSTGGTDARNIELKGTVILSALDKRPKAPANFTVQ